MILNERNNDLSSNVSFTFDFGKYLSNFRCHSIKLNDNENYLLLVGNHEIQFVNFETLLTLIANTNSDDHSSITPCPSHIQSIPLYDTYKIHRSIVQWNPHDTNQYALANDRLVQFYSIDYGRIHGTSSIVDTQHQRPISTLSYCPNDPHCLLTGSLDGQVQVWDIRHCSLKSPANLKLTLTTPFEIRHIQWSSTKSNKINVVNNSNQLAIQSDRCVRIYDMRKTDTYLCSIEHSQRINSMDWATGDHSIVTLSMDNSLRIFSTSGQLLAESLPNEQLPFTLSKIQTTAYDSLFICASRDTISSTFGFTSWRCDEDHYLRPLTDRILSTSPAMINDFTFVTNPKLMKLINRIFSSRSNDDSTKHFPILAWCRDEQLHLIDMDSTFQQTWHDYTRITKRNLSDSTNSTIVSKSSSSSNSSRQQSQLNRSNTNILIMDVIEDESTDPGESDLDDSTFPEMSSPQMNGMESSETGDENDMSVNSDHTSYITKNVTTENEFNTVHDAYGQYIIVEEKDVQRRMCILRCRHPFDSSDSFRICLALSRHYPVISQLFVRFKLSSMANIDERMKSFLIRIRTLFTEISHKCFYYGHLCLHPCLLKLRSLFHSYNKQENFSSTTISNKSNRKHRESLINNLDLDSPNDINQKNPNGVFDQLLSSPSSSSIHAGDNHIANGTSIREKPRTCGARFAGGTHLVCFGRILNLSQQQPTSAPPILSTLNDGSLNRPSPFHIRSISLTVTKSRGNSGTDEPSSSYRSSTTTTTIAANMFSAPVRSSLGSGVLTDHQRTSTSFRRSLNQHLSQTNLTVSIYDISILLPISKKLADDYRIDLNNLTDMCDTNQRLTERMAKYELAHCWRVLAGLLAIQPTLTDDHSWFQTPIAQGLIKHLVSHYVADGDIQSASMFLLTMLQTPFMKQKILNEHYYDPILYSYASLLHRWKHFYKRTQILQKIDHNCQSPTLINQTVSTIICSICLQPVVGQHFLCAICAHGGHLLHMHEWFSSAENKHRYCPEKDCTCRCIMKQQELLTINMDQIQKHQHTPTLTPKPYYTRRLSTSMRPL